MIDLLGGPAVKESEDDSGGPCGVCGLEPQCLQSYRSPPWVLFWLCCASFLQGECIRCFKAEVLSRGMAVNGLVNVVISTLERRFQLSSKESGLIASFYDIGYFFCAIPITYYGGTKYQYYACKKLHCYHQFFLGRPGASKPRYLALGILLLGLGSLIWTLPHFLTEQYTGNGEESDVRFGCIPLQPSVCLRKEDINGTMALTHMGRDDRLANFRFVFFFAQFMIGCGATPLYTLGVTFLDEITSTANSAVYLGTFYSMAVVGPAVGFLLGGQTLKLHTDISMYEAEKLGLTPNNTLWVGAWWVGFLVCAVLSVIIAIPIMAFPDDLPGKKAIQVHKVDEVHQGYGVEEANTLDFSWSTDFPRHLRILLTNPTFIFINFAAASDGLLLAGFSTFLPKYIENQFRLSASLAALLMGSITIPSGGGGTFIGGYVIKRFDLRCASIIKLCAVATLLTGLCSFLFLLDCPNVEYTGYNVGYLHPVNKSLRQPVDGLQDQCNTHCANCLDSKFDPICGADEVMYYSPCYAGCREERRDTDNLKVYESCDCLGIKNSEQFYQRQLKNSTGETSMEAVGELCPSKCSYLPFYMVGLFMVIALTFFDSQPGIAATLSIQLHGALIMALLFIRCVPRNQRSLALGIQWVKIRLLGTIPAPVIFGTIMDLSCTLWQKSNDDGSCRAYDNFWISRQDFLT
ncbi:unnamed protein product [Darwinula stevensoni]|uniref:Solute carrier organic anion transporter family member n=1 Tax=Darwinula stevensoni TaxID=69355 RepID=A0A7R8XEC1_9CRUS|nr:unnamed protein product [Darwinula stevensoni]CAG0890478.1 unnamed protein product [Darwinula stevensoni]